MSVINEMTMCRIGFLASSCETCPCDYCPHPYQTRESVNRTSQDAMDRIFERLESWDQAEKAGCSDGGCDQYSEPAIPESRDYLITGTIQLLVSGEDETEAMIKFKDALNDFVTTSEYPLDLTNGSTIDDVKEF